MTHTIINPADLHDPVPFGYSHTARVPGGSELVLVSGQYGSAADGRVVSPVFAEQVHRALDNLTVALAAHGLTLADVVQLRTYVVSLDFEKLAAFAEVMKARWGAAPPTNTLIGVAALASPDMLFEVDAVAVRA